MHEFGQIVIIKRNGDDGPTFNLVNRTCTFGR
jgi:hypothetical protein